MDKKNLAQGLSTMVRVSRCDNDFRASDDTRSSPGEYFILVIPSSIKCGYAFGEKRVPDVFWFLLAGLVAGSALGFVGAGGPMIGLPIILAGTQLTEHAALGTNATAVSVLAAVLAAWSIYKGQSHWREALVFSIPGLVGAYFGIRLGLAVSGRQLIFILGLVIFIAAAWMFWLSRRKQPLFDGPPSNGLAAFQRRTYVLIPAGLVVGWVSGFFAVGGGFMIVIALMLGGKLPVRRASQTALIPIALFTGLEGGEYAAAGHVYLGWAGIMLATGLLSGVVGLRLANKTPRHLLQGVLSGLFVLIGVYFLIR